MHKSCRSTMKKKKPPVNIIKASFRSPIFKKPVDYPSYKVVTQTYSGESVTVPTTSSYIPFKTKPIIAPIKNDQYELIKIIGRKRYAFDDALYIYENNQSCYLNMIEHQPIKTESILKEVENLEKWFCQIKEPEPKDKDELEDWQEREMFKHFYHYSKYFNQTLLYYYNKSM